MTARISVKTWNIGPRHDPYGASRLSYINSDGDEIEFEENGLGYCALYVCGAKVQQAYDEGAKLVEASFERHAGFSVSELQKFYNRLERRMWESGCVEPTIYM
jgi:hypothetical protein